MFCQVENTHHSALGGHPPGADLFWLKQRGLSCSPWFDFTQAVCYRSARGGLSKSMIPHTSNCSPIPVW